MSAGTPVTPPVPSPRRLAAATAASAFVAGVILVVAVLPVEFGVDPLGAGRALGLVRTGSGADEVARMPAAGERLTPAPVGPVAYYGAGFASDHAVFTLGPYGTVEYKYRLESGAAMLFTWDATEEVIQDFHGVRDEPQAGQEVSFDTRERRRASGSHVAPFSGMHGWYWENPGASPVTITVTSAGFYSAAIEYRQNRRQVPHALSAGGADDTQSGEPSGLP